VLPRRCLAKDTHILMSNGSWKFLKDIKKGDLILSWNGQEIVSDVVKKIWSTGVKETKIIKSFGNIPITTSHDHLFANSCQNSAVMHWDKASELKARRQLVTYNGKITFKLINNPDMAEFIGYMTCDGYVVKYQQPKFTNINLDILKRVEYLANKLFGYKAIWRKKGKCFDLGLSNGTNGGGTFKNTIKELFRDEHQDIPKSKKRLLSIVWGLDLASIGRLFAAIISSDGNIYIHKERTFKNPKRNNTVTIRPTVEITLNCGKSYDLCYDIYWLLRKFCYLPHMPYLERGSNWKIKIGRSCDVKNILSFGDVYGKTEAQQQALLLLSDINPMVPKVRKLSTFKSVDGLPVETYDIETKTNHNFFANGYLVHNSGKDIVALNLAIRQLLTRVCTVYYVFPTYSQARKALWDAIDIQGQKILDYIPEELIATKNSSDLKVTFTNGSVLQFIGSDNYDRLRGTNPYGVIFSEYATQNPFAYATVRPILAANGGWVIMASTPFGKNHFWDLYQIAKNSKDWFCYHLTLDDTQHIPIEEIDSLRLSGEMSESMINQEFFCSFETGVEGSYYAKIINELRLNNRIGEVQYESSFPVHTAWDVGYTDATAIIFFQVIGKSIHIIDYYENNNMAMEEYVQVVKAKPYAKNYGRHVAPHDISNKNSSNGLSPMQIASQLGLDFIKGPRMEVFHGIQAVRAKLPTFWIDMHKCSILIKMLENYRKVYNQKKMDFEQKPLHDFSSHGSDAMRLLCTSLNLLQTNSTAEEINARYNRVMYGTSGNKFNPLG